MILSRIALPLACLSLLVVGGAATATPITSDPFVLIGATASPRAVAIAADGEFFVANFGLNSISAYTAGGVFEGGRSVPMGAGSHPIDVALDGKGAVWSANIDAHALGRFVPGATVPTLFDLGVGFEPEAIVVTSTDVVYSVNGSTNTVSKVELVGATYQTTPAFARLAFDAKPAAIATDSAGTVYTANAGNGTVSRITSGGAVTDVVAQLPTGGAPDAIVIDSTGMIFVANTNRDAVVKIDPSKPMGANTIATFQLAPGAKPFGLAVDARDNVYVTNRGVSTVSVIATGATDPVTIQSMPVGSGVSGIAVSPKNLLITTSFARGVASSLDLATAVSLTAPVTGATVGAPLTGTLSATGVDPLAFAAVGLPGWLTLDAKTGVFTGTPPVPGAVTFTVTATSLVSTSPPLTVAFIVGGVAPTATATPAPPATANPTATASPTTTTRPASTTTGAGAAGAAGSHPSRALAETGAGDGVVPVALGALVVALGVALSLLVRLRRRKRHLPTSH